MVNACPWRAWSSGIRLWIRWSREVASPRKLEVSVWAWSSWLNGDSRCTGKGCIFDTERPVQGYFNGRRACFQTATVSFDSVRKTHVWSALAFISSPLQCLPVAAKALSCARDWVPVGFSIRLATSATFQRKRHTHNFFFPRSCLTHSSSIRFSSKHSCSTPSALHLPSLHSLLHARCQIDARSSPSMMTEMMVERLLNGISSQ